MFEIVNWFALYPQFIASDKGNFVVVKKWQLVTRLVHHGALSPCRSDQHIGAMERVAIAT
jgi:hypothetical protein